MDVLTFSYTLTGYGFEHAKPEPEPNVFQMSDADRLEYMQRESARVLKKPYESRDDEMRRINAELDASMIAAFAFSALADHAAKPQAQPVAEPPRR